MLYREIIAVCSQIHIKQRDALCGQNVEFVNVKHAPSRKRQITVRFATHSRTGGSGVLSRERAPCRSSCTQNLEVARGFVENMWTPAVCCTRQKVWTPAVCCTRQNVWAPAVCCTRQNVWTPAVCCTRQNVWTPAVGHTRQNVWTPDVCCIKQNVWTPEVCCTRQKCVDT